MSMIEDLNEDTFEAAIKVPGLAVIDFWGGWCGPCRAMAPQFERAAALRPQYRFAKVDVDAEPALSATYGSGRSRRCSFCATVSRSRLRRAWSAPISWYRLSTASLPPTRPKPLQREEAD
jgi:thiol-disulfide isomerase/thioredoxin